MVPYLFIPVSKFVTFVQAYCYWRKWAFFCCV